jgi:hypothetical protein
MTYNQIKQIKKLKYYVIFIMWFKKLFFMLTLSSQPSVLGIKSRMIYNQIKQIRKLIVNKDEFSKNKIFIFLKYWPISFEIYKHIVKSKMQGNNLCLRNPMLKQILKHWIFFFKKKKC